MRHTIESIGVAIVLAFVLRAFLVEAFVIPTGSMAPGLMGEHFDLTCTHCGYEFDFGYLGPALTRSQTTSPKTAYCPNCRRAYPTDNAHWSHVNGGDRVLVLKFLYDFSEPKPWDVVVFRNPQNNRENFIKRLIGLPGETIEIVRGDIWFQAPGDETWQIRRKPDKVQEAMWTVVYDNDYPVADPSADDPAPRWISAGEADAAHWDLTGNQGRLFRYRSDSGRPARLIFDGDELALFPFYAYNRKAESQPAIRYDNNHDVCTDLQLSAVFVPESSDSRIALRLDVIDHRLVAEIAADGTVRLWRQGLRGEEAGDSVWFADGAWSLWQEAQIDPLTPGRGAVLAMANVDFRLSLSVNGQRVLASSDEQYPADHDALKRRLRNRELLPMPAAEITASGGGCELLHIRLDRDVFHTNAGLAEPTGITSRYADHHPDFRDEVVSWAHRPGWGVFDSPITLQDDAFFVLGDNSPQSLDSRRWVQVAPTIDPGAAGPVEDDDLTAWQYQMGTVPRSNMIGKAMFVSGPRATGLLASRTCR